MDWILQMKVKDDWTGYKKQELYAVYKIWIKDKDNLKVKEWKMIYGANNIIKLERPH